MTEIFDNAQALTEGWKIIFQECEHSQGGKDWFIEPTGFETDEAIDADEEGYQNAINAAIMTVLQRAFEGSRYHKDAISFLYRNSPDDEFEALAYRAETEDLCGDLKKFIQTGEIVATANVLNNELNGLLNSLVEIA